MENHGPQFTRYTPLNVDRGRILDEALSVNLIPTSRRAMIPENANWSRTYLYHKKKWVHHRGMSDVKK